MYLGKMLNFQISVFLAWWIFELVKFCNNISESVPPSERVYPQHLIGVAIDLLEAADVDWDEVRNVEELREQLNL